MLCSWHKLLMNGRQYLGQIGAYRTHKEVMQIISSFHKPVVHFEAPSSERIVVEMDKFIKWFQNSGMGISNSPIGPLCRAGIAHLYFECIHPFEDGNGRIGRGLIEKVFAEHISVPILLDLSATILEDKKAYYQALEDNNKQLDITPWLMYFADLIIKAKKNTHDKIEFLIRKTRFLETYQQQVNERQLKAILRMLSEGTKGLIGGLSSYNYQQITKASPATTTRDLAELVKIGALTKEGERKARYYLNLI